MDCSTDRRAASDRSRTRDICGVAGFPLSSSAAETSRDGALARDMIAVHGSEAAVVARSNARSAALAGRYAQAKSWIKVLGIIQRHQKERQFSGNPSSASPPAPRSTQG